MAKKALLDEIASLIHKARNARSTDDRIAYSNKINSIIANRKGAVGSANSAFNDELINFVENRLIPHERVSRFIEKGYVPDFGAMDYHDSHKQLLHDANKLGFNDAQLNRIEGVLEKKRLDGVNPEVDGVEQEAAKYNHSKSDIRNPIQFLKDNSLVSHAPYSTVDWTRPWQKKKFSLDEECLDRLINYRKQDAKMVRNN